jgi:hypothetical protein
MKEHAEAWTPDNRPDLPGKASGVQASACSSPSRRQIIHAPVADGDVDFRGGLTIPVRFRELRLLLGK